MENSRRLEKDLIKTGALLKGHFVLSSGKHSPAYVQCAKLLQYPDLCEKYAKILAGFYENSGITSVLGPALGGVVLGYEIARQAKARSIFTERDDGGVMLLRRGFEIEPGEEILVSEDVITTGKSTSEVIEVIYSHGGVIGGVCCLINRSGGGFDPGVPVKSLITMELDLYEPADCPLCRENVPSIKPGSRKG
jgi:orotate phosphoribosyltransferase